MIYNVTGTTTYSRLPELKKYKITNIFENQYFGDGSTINDGVDYYESISGVSVTYYIGGIKYVDNITASTTTIYSSATTFTSVPIVYSAVTIVNTIGTPYTAVTTSYSKNGIIYNMGTSIYTGTTKLYYSTGVTTYTAMTYSTDNPNFITIPYYKNPDKENIISNPKIKDDVFIDRSELSAFDSNYRLEFIKNLVDLTTYTGGKYFNIVNYS